MLRVAVSDLRLFTSEDKQIELTPVEIAILAFLLFNAQGDGVDDDDIDDMNAILDGLFDKVVSGD